jgi:hypothetical protein
MGVLRIVLYLVVVFLLVKPLGTFMARVFQGERTWLDRFVGPLERLLYRWSGVNPEEDMPWQTYTVALLVFTTVGMLLLYALQRLQAILPLNPQAMSAVSPDLSLNTAVSFTTNTNWQNYGGESTLSYFTQMAGLTVKNFVSASVGLAVMVALIRGLARHLREVDRPGIAPGLPGRRADPVAIPDRDAGRADVLRPAGDRREREAGARRQGPAHDQDRQGDGTGDRRGPGRLADRHQAARHERRRVLQHELGHPV